MEGEVASFLIALLKYPRPILDYLGGPYSGPPKVGPQGWRPWRWPLEKAVYLGQREGGGGRAFLSECVFLLCYKASDSIREVSRRAGMRACQLGREPETASGVQGPGAGTGIQTPGTGEKRPGTARSEQSANPSVEAPQRPARFSHFL